MTLLDGAQVSLHKLIASRSNGLELNCPGTDARHVVYRVRESTPGGAAAQTLILGIAGCRTKPMEKEEMTNSGSMGTALIMTVVAPTMQPHSCLQGKSQSFDRIIC